MAKGSKGGGLTPRNIIIGILLLVMVVSGIGVIREQIESRRQREEQERLAQLASQTTEEVVIETETEKEPETEPPYVSPIDFETLQAENPDVVGWIRIPDTRIDYPILYDAESNEKYLHTDFDGNESVYGAIYLDCDSEPDFSGWNNPIYGHHMKDGSMFKDVVKFKDPEYFKAHQYFEVYTPERTIHLKAVSCYYTGSDGIVRKTKFKSQESYDAWLKERLEPCSYAEMPEVSVGSVFTLVTCSYEMKDARTLLYAVEVDENGEVIPAGEETEKVH
ncbi:MAG: class B sortase [Eubacteriales bacterium]|nr:class B sortase [Eubacteriales bacterium]